MTSASQLHTWSGPEAGHHLDDLVAIYKEAFLDVWEADPEQAARQRRGHLRTHFRRPDITVITASDDAGRLVGFVYGHPGRRGTWWHDTVCSQLSPDEHQRWMSESYEVVELHVLPHAQGAGLGRRLLRQLLATTSATTAVLSALDDAALPARHLYASEGFTLLRNEFTFPGTSVNYAILAADLPLPHHDLRVANLPAWAAHRSSSQTLTPSSPTPFSSTAAIR